MRAWRIKLPAWRPMIIEKVLINGGDVLHGTPVTLRRGEQLVLGGLHPHAADVVEVCARFHVGWEVVKEG